MNKSVKMGAVVFMLSSVLFLAGTLQRAEAADCGNKENSWRYEDGVLLDLPEEGEIETAAVLNTSLVGIDVSEHNKVIDWEKVKESGVDFAILRCGYGNDYIYQDDLYWERNVAECERLGIPFGVYLYSYAQSEVEAMSEARHVLRLIEGHKLSMPVYYDLEDKVIQDDDPVAYAKIFCKMIIEAGYPVGVYANLYWWNTYLTDPCFLNWHRWVAQYNTCCDYKGIYSMWQSSSKGQMEGIEGNVDVNYLMGTPADHGPFNEISFEDVNVGDWFRHSALYAASEGIMTGLTQKKFGHSDPLYRVQFATILYRMSDSPDMEYQDIFPDVEDGYFYSQAVIWANSVEVIQGYASNGWFGTGDLITREQMAVMMYRYAKYLEMDTSARKELKEFKDAKKVTGYAQEAVEWAVAEGLLQGDGGKLNPQGTANRAECSIILMRFLDLTARRK